MTGFDVPWGSEVILEGVIESANARLKGHSVSLPATTQAGAYDRRAH